MISFDFLYVRLFLFLAWFIIIGLSISTLVHNGKIIKNMKKNQIDDFHENVVIQKRLIWTTCSVILICAFVSIVSCLYSIKIQQNSDIDDLFKPIFYFLNCILFVFTIIYIGMTSYMNNILNNTNIDDNVDDNVANLNKIYIVSCIMNIAILIVFYFMIFRNQSTIFKINTMKQNV